MTIALNAIGIGILIFNLIVIFPIGISMLICNDTNDDIEFYGLMCAIASTIPLAIIGSILSFM